MNTLNDLVQAANKKALEQAIAVARTHNTTLSVLLDGKVIELSPNDFEKLIKNDKTQ